MLIHWPTIITAMMFPVLMYVYSRLSKREECEMLGRFGAEYLRYMEQTPMFAERRRKTQCESFCLT